MVFDQKAYMKEYYQKNREKLLADKREKYLKTHPNKGKLIHHHVKYKEIHGEDKIVLMSVSDHKKLHARIRRDGKCKIPPNILRKTAISASRRSPCAIKYREVIKQIHFSNAIAPNVRLRESIHYNVHTGTISFCMFFEATNNYQLYTIGEIL